ncbi:MAG: DUF4139 domain-containing protein [Deltaproteobacteria bacterium]|nr:DUF4139 domain-containing protein [Deltaproteobacteria bacterium]
MSQTVPHAAVDIAWRTVAVTVYEDRADVVRVADITLPAGTGAVRLSGLSPLVDEARLVARVERPDGARHDGARVDDVVIVRRVIGADDDELQRRRRQRQEARDRLVADKRAVDDELVACAAAAEDAWTSLRFHLDAVARQLGCGGSARDLDASFAPLAQAARDADAALAAARAQVARLAIADKALAAPIRLPGRTRRVGDVIVHLGAAAAEGDRAARLVVATVVPCAAWRPSHEARLARHHERRDAGDVTFVTHAAVWNRTGEDWRDARVVLSTARPSQGASLPPLHEDRLQLRSKTAEERRVVVVEHRTEAVPASATRGGAPGVDDGGEARVFAVDNASVPDDGRPHLLPLAAFQTPCALARVCVPERSPLVYLRASLKNASRAPILAGPVTLVVDGSWVGIGDVLYTGQGDDLDLSFGSDDRFVARLEKTTHTEQRLMGRDVQHYIQRATLTSTASAAEEVVVVLRTPVSELAQVTVVPSAQHITERDAAPDPHGLVRARVKVEPGRDRVVAHGFSFDASGDVQLPPPW